MLETLPLPQIIAVLAALVVLFAALGLRTLVGSRERTKIDQRLLEIKAGGAISENAPMVYLTDTPLPFPLPGVAFLGWTLPHLATSEDLQWELAQAGFRHPDARRVFSGSKMLFTTLLGLTAFVVGSRFLLEPATLAMTVITAALVGYFAPTVWLAWKRARRQEEITLSLPDALDLMVVCVEAGQGLNSAMVSVGREISHAAPALSEELRLVNQEIRAGLSRAQSLRNFAERTGVDDIRAMVAVLVQSDRLGTSIANALRVHAQSLRIRRRQRAEAAARKTAVKLVFPLVLCIFPALLVVILAPGMIQLIRTLMETGTTGG
jgi:tight adherence protein C